MQTKTLFHVAFANYPCVNCNSNDMVLVLTMMFGSGFLVILEYDIVANDCLKWAC